MNGRTNISTNPYWFREHRFFWSFCVHLLPSLWHDHDITGQSLLTSHDSRSSHLALLSSSPSCHSPELQSGHWTHTSGCDASELTSDGELGMVLWSMTMRPGVRTQGRWESCDHCRTQSVPGQTLTSSHLSLAQQKTLAKIIKRKSQDTKKVCYTFFSYSFESINPIKSLRWPYVYFTWLNFSELTNSWWVTRKQQ